MRVGKRELKSHLSQYLRRVEKGESLYVTDRGRIVAEIKPVKRGRTQDEIWRDLAAHGLVSLGVKPGKYTSFKPVKLEGPRGRLDEIISELRGPR